MTEKQKHELKVGATVLAGLCILLIGIALVKGWSVTGGDYSFLIRFQSSAGLQKGDIVTVNGVKSGSVESVVVDGASVLVRVQLHDDVRLTRDVSARIQMLELMGGKKVEILQGRSAEMYDVHTILVGSVDPDISGALGMVGDLKNDVGSIGTNAATLLENLNALLGDKQFQASVKGTFVHLNETMTELRDMIAENRSNTKRITENIARLTLQLDSMLTEFRPEVRATLDKTRGTLMQTDSVFSEMKFLLRDIRERNGFLHTALYDSTFAMRVDSMMGRVNKVLETLLDNGVKVRIRL